jgi:hypothetical protein
VLHPLWSLIRMVAPKMKASKLAFSVVLSNVQSKGRLTARVYLPVLEKRRIEGIDEVCTVWLSRYTVLCGRKARRGIAGGDNWLQAILMATEAIRRCMPEGEAEHWVDRSGVPSWVMFPRLVPISSGYEFHENLLKLIEKQEREYLRKERRK